MRSLVAAPLLALLLLAGCGDTDEGETAPESSSSPSVDPSTDPSAAPSVDPAGSEEYAELVALRDAAIETGYECEAFVSDDRIPYAAESGACDGQDVFSVYDDQESLNVQVQTLEQISEEFGLEPGSSLVGANWTITSDPTSIEDLQAELGGTITN